MKGSQWWDVMYNPVTGCTPCSPACDHCYAARMAGRHLPVTRCPECGGDCMVTVTRHRPGFLNEDVDVDCFTCDGTGRVQS